MPMPFRGSFEQSSDKPVGANFLGFQEVALTDVVDKSTDYPNMDMFIEVYFRNGNSQYPWKYSLLGTFDRENDDTVSGTSSLWWKGSCSLLMLLDGWFELTLKENG